MLGLEVQGLGVQGLGGLGGLGLGFRVQGSSFWVLGFRAFRGRQTGLL